MYDLYMTGLARYSKKNCPHLSQIPWTLIASTVSKHVFSRLQLCMLRQSGFEGCKILHACLWLCDHGMLSFVHFLAKVWCTTRMTNPGLIGRLLLCSSSLDSGIHATNQVAVLFLLTFWSSALTLLFGQNKCFTGLQRFQASCTRLRK